MTEQIMVRMANPEGGGWQMLELLRVRKRIDDEADDGGEANLEECEMPWDDQTDNIGEGEPGNARTAKSDLMDDCRNDKLRKVPSAWG